MATIQGGSTDFQRMVGESYLRPLQDSDPNQYNQILSQISGFKPSSNEYINTLYNATPEDYRRNANLFLAANPSGLSDNLIGGYLSGDRGETLARRSLGEEFIDPTDWNKYVYNTQSRGGLKTSASGLTAPTGTLPSDYGGLLNLLYPNHMNTTYTAPEIKEAPLIQQPTSTSQKTSTNIKGQSEGTTEGLASNQMQQYNQLRSAGASHEAALQAAMLVPTGGAQQQGTQQQVPALTMPANGSVVDLLKMAGQDSSFAARQQLASQFGIQNYTGTAAQNTQLAQKYIDSHNKLKGSPVPQNAAEARGALQNYQQQNQQGVNEDPTRQFMDIFGSMSPIESNLFEQISSLLDTQKEKQSLTEFYTQEIAKQGIPGLNMELADIKRIMDGTEDDIRAEIASAGGFATESQVQALSGARNKVLLRKANYLTDVINAKNDYVNNIVSLTKADREQISKDLDQKLGITKMVFDMTTQLQDRERENYQNLVSAVGYDGLAEMLQNSPSQRSQVEKSLGLPNGALSNPAFLQAAAPDPKLTTQVIEVEGRKALVTFDQLGNPVNVVDLGAADVPGGSGSGGLTPGQINAFNSIVSKYNSSPLIAAADRTAVLSQTIQNVKKDPKNAAQQLNLVYSYVQALDTYQSAVREGELALVNSIDSRIGQLSSEVQKIQNGQVVRPEVALQIANAAQDLVTTINSAAKQKAQSYASQANVVGLGPYWNQYVSGFSQGYNNQPSTANAKGSLSSGQYVEQTLSQKGYSYQQVLNDIPFGYIGVIDNSTGEIGSVLPEEFNSFFYTRI